MSSALFELPHGGGSLPLRNLQRGQTLQLPSGQDVAKAVAAPLVFSGAEMGTDLDPTLLWFYLLKEAELEEGNNGVHLGVTAGRIVGETLLGLLAIDEIHSSMPTRSGGQR